MSNNVYYTEWTAKFGASWRLEIQDPADTILSDPIYIKFPKQAVSFEDFGWEFDDIPLGIMSDTALSVSWALSEIADLTELKDMLFNPTVTVTTPDSYAPDITAGNLYTLYRNSDVIYRGVQLQGYRYGMTVSNGIIEYKAEIVGLGKYILSCFDLPEFNNLFFIIALTMSRPAKFVIEQIIGDNSGLKTIINAARFEDVHKEITNNENDAFYFLSFADFEAYMKLIFEYIYNKLLRATGATIEFKLPFLHIWEQVLKNAAGSTVALGANLTKATTYLPAVIKRDGEYIGGFVYRDSGIGAYKVFYDFLADMSADHVVKYRVSPDGSKFLPYYFFGYICDPDTGTLGNIDTVTFNTNEVIELELEHYITNQITASLEEFTSSDVDNYRFNDGTLRNDDELQVPILFNTSPPANNYTTTKSHKYSIMGQGITPYTKLEITGDALRLFRYYYFAEPSFINGEVVVPAHSFCSTFCNSVEPLNGGTTLPIIEDTKAWILRLQKESAKPLLFSDFREILDAPRNSKLKIKFPATNEFNKIFDGINSAFYIDLAKWDSYLSNYPDTWYLTKVEYSFEDDCFSLELFGSWAGSR